VQNLPGGDTQIYLNRNEWQAVNSRNHLPQMKISEFINELARRFNLQFNYNAVKKTVEIVRLNEFVYAPTQILDLTPIANPKPNIIYEAEDDFLNGYSFAFATDPEDAASGADIEGIDGLVMRGIVDAEHLLSTIATPVNNDIAYVRNVNAYYKYVVIGFDASWEFYSHNLFEYNAGNKSAATVETKILTMPMQVVPVYMVAMDNVMGTPAWTDPGGDIDYSAFFGTAYENVWESVPFSNIGISFDFYNVVDWGFTDWGFFWPNPWVRHRNQVHKDPKPHLPKLINCIGLTPGYDTGVWTANYFMGTSTSYNCSGAVEALYSGAWTNKEDIGLYQDWWEKFVEAIKDSFVIEQEVLFDLVKYTTFDPNNTMVVIQGQKYYVKKANFVMPFPEIATLYLVRV
jgi:hypothetical protein